jgi:hypothetical protein
MGAAKRRTESAATGCPYHASIAAIEAPARIRALPTDARGFPVPWFVAWVDGKPDHRIVDSSKFAPAINSKLCWTCGRPLGQTFAFVIGPMCAINRVISEPPSHRECCEYSLRACPWLSRPNAHRRVAGLPDDVSEPAGEGLKRNPGVCVLWVTRGYKPFRVDNGLLFRLGDPIETIWYTEGRPASRDEAVSAVYRGLPALIEIAQAQSIEAEYALAAQVSRVPALFPRFA